MNSSSSSAFLGERFLMSTTVYWHFLRKLFHSTSSVAISRANLMMHTIGRLKWYPLVLLLLYLPCTLNRISQIISKNHDPKYILTFIQYAVLSICGFCNSMIYSWTKPVKQKYNNICCNLLATDNEHESTFYDDFSDLDDTR